MSTAMRFDGELAEIRFGCGLSPNHVLATGPEDVLSQLAAPDLAAQAWPIPDFDGAMAEARAYISLRQEQREAVGTEAFEARNVALTEQRARLRDLRADWFRSRLLRCATSAQPFRERLTLFWADHFTAQGKVPALRYAASPYVESSIRPNVSGLFEDLLIAAVTGPLMLHYLDQHRSTGPNSPRAKRVSDRRGQDIGLNENLAREVLELHTLGVDGPYTQQDVRELAELFTGLGYSLKDGFTFRPGWAEPGAETVLGQSYGGDSPQLEPILNALRDLARHPATAQHISRKLAVHFVSDAPDRHLVAYMAGRYQETGGDLLAVYAAMLDHPEAWQPQLANVKPPFSYLASACRALAIPPAALGGLSRGQINRFFLRPMQAMGQRWEFAGGPDGWAEADAAWITPQALAERIRWSMDVPARLLSTLPDPQQAADQALGARQDARLRFVVSAAETEREALGLILTSPAFQRR